MGITEWFIAIISGLAGAIITGFFTLEGIKKSNTNNINLKNLQNLENLQYILISLKEELTQVYKLSGITLGEWLKDTSNNYLDYGFKCDQKYFYIYENISSEIGMINDKELIKSIVETYTLLSNIINLMLMYNDFLDNYHATDLLQKNNKNDGEIYQILKNNATRLIKFKKWLNKNYQLLTNSKDKTIQLINEYLDKLEKKINDQKKELSPLPFWKRLIFKCKKIFKRVVSGVKPSDQEQ